MLFAPLEGWRHAIAVEACRGGDKQRVTERRTAIDYAKILRDLSVDFSMLLAWITASTS